MFFEGASQAASSLLCLSSSAEEFFLANKPLRVSWPSQALGFTFVINGTGDCAVCAFMKRLLLVLHMHVCAEVCRMPCGLLWLLSVCGRVKVVKWICKAMFCVAPACNAYIQAGQVLQDCARPRVLSFP